MSNTPDLQSQQDKRLVSLRKTFIEEVIVRDQKKGYLSIESFNVRMKPETLETAALCIATQFRDLPIDVVYGIPQNGKYLGTAVALELASFGRPVRLHASSKGPSVPGAWRDVYRGDVPSFTTSDRGAKSASLNFASVEAGTHVLLVDDVCAYGNTALTVVRGMRGRGAEVVGFGVMFDKVWQGGLQRVRELDVGVFSCVSVERIRNDGAVEVS